MYGGGGTPVTDDESEEEQLSAAGSNAGSYGGYSSQQQVSNYGDYSGGGGAGGGFTETVLDNNDDHDDAMSGGVGGAGVVGGGSTNNSGPFDDGAVDDNDGGGGESENWVSIDYEGQSFRVPICDRVRTFGDIKRYLLEKQHERTSSIEITSSHYIVDTVTDHEYQDDDDVMIANHRQLLIRWNCFFVNITDGLDFREDIRVAEDFTIQRIKDQVEKDRNVRLDQLSKDGLELQNDKTLREYNIIDTGHTLISRICVTIIDQQCELTTDILVCEFWSIEDVLSVYLQSSRREKHKNATLSLNNEVLDLQSTVYDEKIENQCTLYYAVGKYTVLVYDSEINNTGYSLNHGGTGQDDQPCLEIEVMDNQSIVEIQETYARLTRKPFMKNDKLLSNERQLEENVPLFKLRIKDNEPLIIEREQQQKPAQYICAECGSIVSLRPYDAVQCRECFMNIVYKKRTLRVCQYNCR